MRPEGASRSLSKPSYTSALPTDQSWVKPSPPSPSLQPLLTPASLRYPGKTIPDFPNLPLTTTADHPPSSSCTGSRTSSPPTPFWTPSPSQNPRDTASLQPLPPPTHNPPPKHHHLPPPTPLPLHHWTPRTPPTPPPEQGSNHAHSPPQENDHNVQELWTQLAQIRERAGDTLSHILQTTPPDSGSPDITRMARATA